VAVTGTNPIYLQWQKNGVDLPAGLATTQLVLTNMIESDSGTYSVVARNPGARWFLPVRWWPSRNRILPGGAPAAAVGFGDGKRRSDTFPGRRRCRAALDPVVSGLFRDVSRPIAGATSLSVTLSSNLVSERVWARITNVYGRPTVRPRWSCVGRW